MGPSTANTTQFPLMFSEFVMPTTGGHRGVRPYGEIPTQCMNRFFGVDVDDPSFPSSRSIKMTKYVW